MFRIKDEISTFHTIFTIGETDPHGRVKAPSSVNMLNLGRRSDQSRGSSHRPLWHACPGCLSERGWTDSSTTGRSLAQRFSIFARFQGFQSPGRRERRQKKKLVPLRKLQKFVPLRIVLRKSILRTYYFFFFFFTSIFTGGKKGKRTAKINKMLRII